MTEKENLTQKVYFPGQIGSLYQGKYVVLIREVDLPSKYLIDHFKIDADEFEFTTKELWREKLLRAYLGVSETDNRGVSGFKGAPLRNMFEHKLSKYDPQTKPLTNEVLESLDKIFVNPLFR